jgi:hypothetical protein
MKVGEKGNKFYIILRGKVSVKVPTRISKSFTFKQLLKMLVDYEESIIENERYQEVLSLISWYFCDSHLD